MTIDRITEKGKDKIEEYSCKVYTNESGLTPVLDILHYAADSTRRITLANQEQERI